MTGQMDSTEFVRTVLRVRQVAHELEQNSHQWLSLPMEGADPQEIIRVTNRVRAGCILVEMLGKQLGSMQPEERS